MDVDDEPHVFRLLAYSLVRHLDLRLECADAVYFELLSERALVRSWLARQTGRDRLRAALAEVGAAVRGRPHPAHDPRDGRPAGLPADSR
jgi:hypothetical protein